VDGIELVGEFEGSGYREPPQLVCRPDGQLVRLPALLYRVVQLLDGRPPGSDDAPVLACVAAELSRGTGRRFTAEHVAFLLDEKLAPLGVTTRSDGSPPPPTSRRDPFLAFRFRLAVLPERITWWLSGLFAWLFRPPLVLLVLGVFAAGETWLWATRETGPALRAVLSSPGEVLLVLALAVASCVFHEMGHGAACRYGGVRPGAMGCGVYLVWPAFYTDITNSYRLGRAGRIRADLGGVYFNALFVLGLLALYVPTGTQWLLVAILSVNLEIVQQLLPTLRFDGYYIVADLIGVPDLFKYIGPILRRVLLRRPPDDRLRSLKRWPQIIVAVWVLFLVPVLCLQLGILVGNLPRLLQVDWERANTLLAAAAVSDAPALAYAAAALRILLLALPVAGLAVTLVRPARSLARFARRRWGKGA
jgi:putative peptide zinc metalloprotease protein